jgi:opacity protein-like surface antigen
MKLRLLFAVLLALGASAAQAAPDVEIRAGSVDMGALGSTTYGGIGLRFRFDETWAAYSDIDVTTSSSGIADAKFNRYGGGVEWGKGDDEFRVNLRLGAVYTDGEVFGLSVSDTSASYGVDFRFRRVGIGFSQSKFNDETVNSTSLAFYF